MYIIVGLGNPSKKYEKTRHNAGFDTIDIIADKYNIRLGKTLFKALAGKGMIGTEKVLLVKPLTFMNLSGDAVRAVMKFYREDPKSHLIVIYDDVALETGKIRIRAKGSAGGHNGMKNIIANLQTEDFARIRIGIGPCPEPVDMIDFVLGRFDKDERIKLEEAMNKAKDAVETIIKEGVAKAQNDYN